MPLAEREIHVWQLDLASARAGLELLSPAEQVRAQHYQCRHARHSFMQTRAALRQVLGSYLGWPAREIELAQGCHGKPRLAAACGFEFNVSHSGQLALIALSSRPVGIDVEQFEPALNWRELAELCCHPAELPALLQLPDAAGRIRFLRLWTLKEAYVKGTGEGLSLPLASLHLEPRAQDWGVAGDASWHLQPLPLPAGYLGSLATRIARPVVRLHTLEQGRPIHHLPPYSPPRETKPWITL